MYYEAFQYQKRTPITLRHRINFNELLQIVDHANHFDSNILLQINQLEVNPKSVLSMAATFTRVRAGEQITIKASGHDEEEALAYFTNAIGLPVQDELVLA